MKKSMRRMRQRLANQLKRKTLLYRYRRALKTKKTILKLKGNSI